MQIRCLYLMHASKLNNDNFQEYIKNTNMTKIQTEHICRKYRIFMQIYLLKTYNTPFITLLNKNNTH